MFQHRKKIPEQIVIPPKEGQGAQPAVLQVRYDKLNAFLALYIATRKGAQWNQDQIDKGNDIKADLPAFRRLEGKMDASWEVLSQIERAEALRALVKEGLIDEGILEGLAVMNATVSKIAYEPPNQKGRVDKVFAMAREERKKKGL